MLRIREELGDIAVRLDHVGSTAVPGLAAKPIIDLQLCVASIQPMNAYRDPLERLGYLFAPDPELANWHFFARPPGRPRTHHLHVFETGSHHERRHLAVREFLRAHAHEAADYETLKRRLAAEHPGDRLAYIKGKEVLMTALQARALAWSDSSAAAHLRARGP